MLPSRKPGHTRGMEPMSKTFYKCNFLVKLVLKPILLQLLVAIVNYLQYRPPVMFEYLRKFFFF